MPVTAAKNTTGTVRACAPALSAMVLCAAYIICAAAGYISARDTLINIGLSCALAAAAAVLRRTRAGAHFAFIPALLFAGVNAYISTQLLSLGQFTWFADVGGPLHVYGVLWVCAVFFALYGFTGGIIPSAAVSGALFLAFGIVNYTLELFRGRPFLAIDITSLRTALSVAGSYEFSVTPLFPTAVLLAASSAVMACLMRPDAASRPAARLLSPALRVASLVLTGYYVYLSLFTGMISGSGIHINWDENEYAGSSVMYFIVTTQKLAVDEPDGYSDEALDTIAGSIENDSGGRESEYPTVIVIMSEAFSDLRAIGDFDTNIPVTPFIDSLADSTVHGTVYSSVFGGNTANSEFEFLTGDTMAFVPTGAVPYQLYINYETDTLVSTLKNQGYTATALHPYLSSGWNRVQVYDLFGFDSVYWKEDFTNRKFLRNYVTDESDYEFLVSLYEQRDPDTPSFFFNITMQNHGSYKFADFESTVSITGHEGEFPYAEQYLSLLNITDSATEELISYFEGVDEPVIILFFGDHQPSLETGFYDLLYGHDSSDLTLEEEQRQYATEFFIWANYDIQTGDVGETSINYLSQLLLEAAGLKTADYGAFLSGLSESWPVINSQGALSSDGTWHSLYDDVFTGSDAIREYKILQYNHLFDPSGVRSAIFSLAE